MTAHSRSSRPLGRGSRGWHRHEDGTTTLRSLILMLFSSLLGASIALFLSTADSLLPGLGIMLAGIGFGSVSVLGMWHDHEAKKDADRGDWLRRHRLPPRPSDDPQALRPD